MTILPKAIHRFSAIPIKTPATLFTEIEKKFEHSHGTRKDPQRARAILNKNNIGEIGIPDLKIYYRAMAIKQYGTNLKTDIYVDQWNKAEDTNMSTRNYNYLILKKAKNVCCKKIGFNKWGNWMPTCTRMKADHD